MENHEHKSTLGETNYKNKNKASLSFVLGFLLCLVFGLIGYALGLILRIKLYSSPNSIDFVCIFIVIMGIELHKSRNYLVTDLFDIIKMNEL